MLDRLVLRPGPDVNPQAQQETFLSSHLTAVIEHLGLGILTFDAALDLILANGPMAELMDLAPSAFGPSALAQGANLVDLFDASPRFHGAAALRVAEACHAAVASASYASAPFDLALAASEPQFSAATRRIAERQWLLTLEPVTQRQAAEALALERACRDPLTGLPNRQAFQDRVAEVLADPQGEGAMPVVLLIDLDRFKAVNDTLGHLVGDALLRLVAKRLRMVVRRDDMVSRLGGDEFTLLRISAAGREGMAALAKRIVDVLGRPYLVEGNLVNIGASAGIACAPQDGRDHDQLLRSADLALYAAKDAGRNTFRFFEPAMDAKALARRTLEMELRKALVLRQFELHYQPQIDIDSNVLLGFEALVRWRHPERGLIAPLDFIPLAEDLGLIGPLGEWVLREACRAASRWPETVDIAVNVSPRQFDDCPKLIGAITHALMTTGLAAHRLEIEITESVMLRNDPAVLAALHEIRQLGVRIAMDDFGTGYSSLSQLNSFPFDKIKIDRSFLAEEGDAEGQNAIIRAITALGASLGMATIAEGVETLDQLSRVRAEGCSSVQGYLYSSAVPACETETLIARFSTDLASSSTSS